MSVQADFCRMGLLARHLAIVGCLILARPAHAEEECPPGSVRVEEQAPRLLSCVDAKKRKQGVSVLFHDNGEISARTPFVDGKREGWQRRWDEHGTPLSAVEFRAGVEVARERMKSDGPVRRALPSDPVYPCPHDSIVAGAAPPAGREQWCERRRDDGAYVRHGTTLKFSGEQISERAEYRDGLLHGTLTTYRSGEAEKLLHYVDGVRQRTKTLWYATGQKRLEITLGEDGVETERNWTERGVLRSEIARREREDLRRTYWYDDGTKRAEETWSGGKRNGRQSTWWPNGTPQKQGEMLDGKEIGLWNEWSPDGKLMVSRTFRQVRNRLEETSRETFRVFDEVPAGWRIAPVERGPSLHEAPALECIGRAKPFEAKLADLILRGCVLGGDRTSPELRLDLMAQGDEDWPRLVPKAGTFEGLVRIWDANGNLVSQTEYRDGKYDGRDVRWLPDGSLVHVRNYAAGFFEGPFASWWPNGAPRACGGTRSGKRDGVFIQCSETGLCTQREEYLAGVKHGLWITWWQNGGKRSESEYRDGLLSGLSRGWAFDGSLQREGHYERGRRVGEWKFYGRDGQLKSSGSYIWCEKPPSLSKAHLGDGKTITESGEMGCKKGMWTYWDEEGVRLGTFEHDETAPREKPPSVGPEPASTVVY